MLRIVSRVFKITLSKYSVQLQQETKVLRITSLQYVRPVNVISVYLDNRDSSNLVLMLSYYKLCADV